MSIEILASKLQDVIGTYRHLSHTVLSCIVSCVHTSEQDVWCWCTVPVPTFGNWVIKGCMTNWLRFFYVCNVFWKSKKHDFLRFFEMLHTFSRTLKPTCDTGRWKCTYGRTLQDNVWIRQWKTWKWRTACLTYKTHVKVFHSDGINGVITGKFCWKQLEEEKYTDRMNKLPPQIGSTVCPTFSVPKWILCIGLNFLVVVLGFI